MPPRPVDIELRVRYAETDQMGVVHHSVHLVWFEMGRTEYCRAAGFSYAEMEKSTGSLHRGGGGPLPLPVAGLVR